MLKVIKVQLKTPEQMLHKFSLLLKFLKKDFINSPEYET